MQLNELDSEQASFCRKAIEQRFGRRNEAGLKVPVNKDSSIISLQHAK
jgi:hypothetical protein